MEAHGNRGLLQTNPYKETLVNPDGMVRFDSAACTSFLRAVRTYSSTSGVGVPSGASTSTSIYIKEQCSEAAAIVLG